MRACDKHHVQRPATRCLVWELCMDDLIQSFGGLGTVGYRMQHTMWLQLGTAADAATACLPALPDLDDSCKP